MVVWRIVSNSGQSPPDFGRSCPQWTGGRVPGALERVPENVPACSGRSGFGLPRLGSLTGNQRQDSPPVGVFHAGLLFEAPCKTHEYIGKLSPKHAFVIARRGRWRFRPPRRRRFSLPFTGGVTDESLRSGTESPDPWHSGFSGYFDTSSEQGPGQSRERRSCLDRRRLATSRLSVTHEYHVAGQVECWGA